MRTAILIGFLLGALPARAEQTWLLQVDRWGTQTAMTLQFDVQDGQLIGRLDGDRVQGRISGKRIAFSLTDQHGKRYAYHGSVDAQGMHGRADFPDTNDPGERASHAFRARRLPSRISPAPQHHVYAPKDFSNEFSAARTPVLTIWPGDSVHTSTVDSGGVDESGRTRALYGNPQTGPFFVMGAEAGDTLVIRLRRLRLNRDWADSLDGLVSRAQSTFMASRTSSLGKPVRWKLDRERRMASLATPSPALERFMVPVRPMLGGLAVAPPDGPGISTGDTGQFGGNMDFNELVEGNTVYLPVQQPGALLYLGDAHALQGDGEIAQFALETSMDVEFVVELIKGKAIGMPRVESPTQLMTLGQAGSLDDALKVATTGMLLWLQQEYGLNLQEASIVLGSCVQYSVANLAGRSVGIAARLDKQLIPSAHRPDGSRQDK